MLSFISPDLFSLCGKITTYTDAGAVYLTLYADAIQTIKITLIE